jgi:uncharacterized protein (DUF427 family)
MGSVICEEQSKYESALDYRLPPRLETSDRLLKVVHAGIVLAETRRSIQILETSYPPVYYIPQEDMAMEYFVPSLRLERYSKFKGLASFWNIAIPATAVKNARGVIRVQDAAWSYSRPNEGYEPLRNFLAVFASRVDECSVDGELVVPQPGDLYGGWITSDVRGPFKGGPGTLGW